MQKIHHLFIYKEWYEPIIDHKGKKIKKKFNFNHNHNWLPMYDKTLLTFVTKLIINKYSKEKS